MRKWEKISKILVLQAVFILIIGLSWTYFVYEEKSENKITALSSKYSLLNNRLFINDSNDIIINFAPLRTEIRSYLAKQDVGYSFFLDYFPSGSSIRAGDKEEYVAASLMKLPIVMDTYKAIDQGKIGLGDRITIDPDDVSTGFGELGGIGGGISLTYRDAIRLTLSESDNTAGRILLKENEKLIPSKERALNFLDIDFNRSTVNQQPTVLISARSYSSFLKCLYLSCFNTYQSSQDILKQLTESSFNNRIKAGVADKSVKIAHKIGTYNKESSSDCGIVYIPSRTYSICVIIGSTGDAADKMIADVSEFAYDYITSVNPPEAIRAEEQP